jgi:hypothetical protein
MDKGEMVPKKGLVTDISAEYEGLLSSIAELLQRGRQHAAKSVNAVLTATYWSIGRRLVEYEQGGKGRAAYGSELLKRLSRDLQSRLGRGFSERNLEQMRQFYFHWQTPQTVSADSEEGNSRRISQTPSAKLSLGDAPAFPLPWSHYVRLLSVTGCRQGGPMKRRLFGAAGRSVSSIVRSRLFPTNDRRTRASDTVIREDSRV